MITNHKCPVCGANVATEGHRIDVLWHDPKMLTTWPMQTIVRKITNIQVRELKDGIVHKERMVPSVELNGVRRVVVDSWSKGHEPAHVIFLPTEDNRAEEEA